MPNSRTNEDGTASTARGMREGGSVAELQRRRLVAATIELMGDGTRTDSVATICTCAGVSRRTFYELFDDREACLLATFMYVTARVEAVVVQAAAGQLRWRDRVRTGLRALLEHFDREPAEARLLIVEALRAGDHILRERWRMVERLTHLVDGGRVEAKHQPPGLTAEGVVGAALSVVHGRISSGDPHPLVGLSGPLAAMVVQPYLGLAAARREIDAPPAASPASIPAVDPPLSIADGDALKDLPMRLTYRTALVIRSIAEHPESSNRQIANAAGVSDPGQISRLLTRLERYGLARNNGGEANRGEAKAWSLTSRGQGVLRVVGEDQSGPHRGAGVGSVVNGA